MNAIKLTIMKKKKLHQTKRTSSAFTLALKLRTSSSDSSARFFHFSASLCAVPSSRRASSACSWLLAAFLEFSCDALSSSRTRCCNARRSESHSACTPSRLCRPACTRGASVVLTLSFVEETGERGVGCFEAACAALRRRTCEGGVPASNKSNKKTQSEKTSLSLEH